MRGWLQALLALAVLPAVQPMGMAPELYCGLESCYDVLGIEREEFDRYRRYEKWPGNFIFPCITCA